jgi:hypothetical protein
MTEDRIQLISHQGKQILTVDLSNCSAPRVDKILREAPEVVATYPLEATITRLRAATAGQRLLHQGISIARSCQRAGKAAKRRRIRRR